MHTPFSPIKKGPNIKTYTLFSIYGPFTTGSVPKRWRLTEENNFTLSVFIFYTRYRWCNLHALSHPLL